MGCNPMVHYYAMLLSIILICSFQNLCHSQYLKHCGFDAIYQFGDSISDTGNSIVEVPQAPHARFPYGETIHRATGRSSDGYLIIDYIAQSAGLPLLEPYENPNSNLSHGVDFAVAGVTALPVKTLAEDLHFTQLPFSNSSLDVQLQWFKKHLSTICNNPTECKEKLKSSLFVVGTIGTNDYYYGLMSNNSIEDMKKTMVPIILQRIKSAVQKVINYGAVRVVVPGTFPLGCTPGLLTWAESNKSAVYDQRGCYKDLDDFFQYHNNHLKVLLQKLRQRNPNVQIIYADYYHALLWIIDNLSKLGFKTFNQTCCGIGGKYNFDPDFRKAACGKVGVPVCPNPGEHVFWDGVHNTHHANSYLAKWVLRNNLSKLQCNA